MNEIINVVLEIASSMFAQLVVLTGGIFNAVGAIIIGIFAFMALYSWSVNRSHNGGDRLSEKEVDARIAARKARQGRWQDL